MQFRCLGTLRHKLAQPSTMPWALLLDLLLSSFCPSAAAAAAAHPFSRRPLVSPQSYPCDPAVAVRCFPSYVALALRESLQPFESPFTPSKVPLAPSQTLLPLQSAPTALRSDPLLRKCFRLLLRSESNLKRALIREIPSERTATTTKRLITESLASATRSNIVV